MYIGIIPVNIRRNKHVSPLAKVLYAEITACMGADICFELSNVELGEMYDVSPKVISAALSELSAREYVDIQVDGNKRKIYLPEKMVFVEERKAEVESVMTTKVSEFTEAIIEYWNRNVGCKRRANATIKAMVRARLKTYSESDIWNAIMNRVSFVNNSDWHNKEENNHHKTNIGIVLRNDESLEKAMNLKSKQDNSIKITKLDLT